MISKHVFFFIFWTDKMKKKLKKKKLPGNCSGQAYCVQSSNAYVNRTATVTVPGLDIGAPCVQRETGTSKLLDT